ncbi:hypothetical protein N7449_000103 [Penicillium cf. viridicatum]|uniref:Uncharacterized protein n=1 Tax=Penicillium cf. viridicatum TaxID=2972119 RepID=A0A9W9N553_9EURO|nr:hypothetical protein N7449_000103 [Penicillium cf. viridicatum]
MCFKYREQIDLVLPMLVVQLTAPMASPANVIRELSFFCDGYGTMEGFGLCIRQALAKQRWDNQDGTRVENQAFLPN